MQRGSMKPNFSIQTFRTLGPGAFLVRSPHCLKSTISSATDLSVFTGTCQLYLDPSKDTICYHAFPPLFTIQDLVEKALGSSKESDAAQTLSTWNTALAAKPSDPEYLALTNLSAQRSHSVSLFRGAAVAIFFSLLISFYNCSSSISLFFLKLEENQERKYRHILFGIAIFDFLLYAGAIVCFTFAIAAGPAVLSGESAGSFGQSIGNMGFIVALVALQLRIISIPIVGAIFLCLLGFELVVFAIFLYFSMKILARIAGSDSLRDAL